MAYEFRAPLWLWDGDAPWHFVTIPVEISDEIEFRTSDRRTGFGSVRVQVTVGTTTWRTSLFPDRGRQAYLLPVKREVRDREGLAVGDELYVTLDLADG